VVVELLAQAVEVGARLVEDRARRVVVRERVEQVLDGRELVASSPRLGQRHVHTLLEIV